MNVDLGIWDKLTRMVVFLLFVAGLLAVAIWYLPLIQANERVRRENLRLETRIKKEEDESKRLRTAIEAFKDPKVAERAVRERMGFGKPGEIIVRFDPPRTNAIAR